MVETQPLPRDVSPIADVDVIPRHRCHRGAQPKWFTPTPTPTPPPPYPHPPPPHTHLKMFLLKQMLTRLLPRPRYHGRVHLNWCISDVPSIANVDDIITPSQMLWKVTSHMLWSAQPPLHEDSSIAFFEEHCPVPDVMEGLIADDAVGTIPTPRRVLLLILMMPLLPPRCHEGIASPEQSEMMLLTQLSA